MVTLVLVISMFSQVQTYLVEPVGERDYTYGHHLSDIISQLPPEQVATYRSSDLVHYAHEATHGVNARLRNQFGGRCFYIMEGKYVTFRPPVLTKSQVALYVPSEYRSVYEFNVYFKDQYWQDDPFHLLDEWIAYTNGSLVSLELGLRGDTVGKMILFNGYATSLLLAVERHDPGYVDIEQLRNFISYMLKITESIADRSPANFSVVQRTMFQKYFVLSDISD